MSLNIKTPEAHDLARELAELTGESLSRAVTEAIRERLARIQEERDGFDEEILRIGRECAARLKEPYHSIDHGELLYDELGLPK